MQWDVFISHAREDKADVARPLAARLEQNGLRVWLDEQELTLGDSPRRKIDEGLARSTWCVLILSKSFLDKEWPQAELDAIFARELGGERVILPIWHRITAAEVAARSPLLAARLAVTTDEGLDAVTAAILRAVNRTPSEPLDPRPSNDGLLTFWKSLAAKDSFSSDKVTQHLQQPSAYEGQTIADYVLKSFLGGGGAGVVFRATHRSLGKTVALKLLFPLREEWRGLTQATERAVRGISTLRHPGIVALLDFGIVPADGTAFTYLAYEFIAGVSLRDWTTTAENTSDASDDAETPVLLSRRLRVAIAITEALRAAHDCTFVGNLGFGERGVLHGDIKPSNIMIRNKTDEPVLLDFMLPDLDQLDAKRRERWSNSSNWEKNADGTYRYDDATTAAFGTPGFMPPEQAVDGIVMPTSDVYALGRTFEVLFWPRHRAEARGVAWHDGPPIERSIARLIERMIAAQPEDRPASAEAVLATLNEIESKMTEPHS